MTAITCIHCGTEGVLNTAASLESSSNVFRRLGGNPVSGHCHYQCPVCKIVLLVAPGWIAENGHIFKPESPGGFRWPSGSTPFFSQSIPSEIVHRRIHAFGRSSA